MRRRITYYLCLLSLIVSGCIPSPRQVEETTDELPIYPDYREITIPHNIAPLNFLIRGNIDAVEVIVKGVSGELRQNSRGKISFPLDEWKAFLNKEKGHQLQVQVTARLNGKWLRYPIFHWEVTEDKIDPYLSYRLIEPGFEVWNALQIRERNLENFDERVIADNADTDRSCMNCHIYGNKRGDLSLFHLRGKQGGTLLNRDGQLRKLNLRNKAFPNGAVYGDLHPSGRYAVFSSNLIVPALHTQDSKRLEVYDSASDLFIADFDNNRLIARTDTAAKQRMVTFPAFSPDGQWIYYCDAPVVSLPDSIQTVRYDIRRIPFDNKGDWGIGDEMVWDSRMRNESASFPKISPDGCYLLFTASAYGTFPIWHRESDLRLIDLTTGKVDSLQTVNSARSDTYHSWSSNSRWFVFASKRDDGLYGKPYLAYIDRQGKVRKPFVIPQEDPEHYDMTLKSYNIPELSASPLPFNAADVRRAYWEMKAEPFQ